MIVVETFREFLPGPSKDDDVIRPQTAIEEPVGVRDSRFGGFPTGSNKRTLFGDSPSSGLRKTNGSGFEWTSRT